MGVKIVNRKGELVLFKMEKLHKALLFAFDGIEGCSKEELMNDFMLQLRDGMSSADIQRNLIQMAVEKTSIQQPNWQFVAARLLAYEVYKQAAKTLGVEDISYGDLHNLIMNLTEKGLYGSYILEHYTKEQVDELASYIKPDRDFLFNYIGIKMVTDRYVIKGLDKEVMELPQQMFMGVAMHLAMKETDKLYWAKRFYDVLSQLKATAATPTLSNARKPFHQLSSCFIDTVPDNLWGIYNVDQSFAQVSKHGGGMGIYVGKVRSSGSDIRGHKGVAGGVIPWVKNYNNTALAVDQLGVRSGSVAIYLDVWHKDIKSFLQLKTNNGDDRAKAHDIFPGVCIPDEFMRRVQLGAAWYLFDPHEIRKVMGFSIEDSWGDEWELNYQACIDNPLLSRDEVPAKDIMKLILISAFETGTPFTFFRDTVNRANPNKHAGMIYCSNLCTEICQNMSETTLLSIEDNETGEITTKIQSGDFVVCNLSSTNMGRVKDLEDLEYTVTTQMRLMDNVIDLNYYPVPQAKYTNKKYRAVGLGQSGWHHKLALNKILWESEEHLAYTDEINEWWAYFAIKASMEIAKEKGPYSMFPGSDWATGAYFDDRGLITRPGGPDWSQLKLDVMMYGIRNGWWGAIAPTGSTSLIAGSTAGIDPVFQKFFIEEKKNGFIPQTAPDLNGETMWYYKEAHNIDQTWSIKAAGIRQRHIDQSQSFNIYLDPQVVTARDFLEMFILAWEKGLKTIYYIRNKSQESPEDCVSCSA